MHAPWRHTKMLVVFALILSLTGLPVGANAPEDGCAPGGVVDSPEVATPEVAGPVSGGIRTGQPYGTTLVPLRDGWVEEEFFFGGTARTYPTGTASPQQADYKTRIVVRRPTDPAAFNGTVLLDWTNVTIPDDTDVAWGPGHATFMERGFVYVSVSAQRLAVEASPLALKQWDPVRYGSLNHPGDDYSFDIFSQASEAVLVNGVLGDLRPCVARRLAIGASQSAGRLTTYINRVHEEAGVFDGYLPLVSGAGSVRRDVAPVLWLNSQSEISGAGVAEDSGLFRLWEVSGPAHTTNEYNAYTNAQIVHAHSNGQANTYNHDEVSTWGYRATPGTCITRNHYQFKYVASAAIVTLDDWVRTGVAPVPMPRAARANGQRLYDANGHVADGVRSPLVDVPIATYFGGGTPPDSGACGAVGGRLPLTGTTQIFGKAELAARYSSGADYLAQIEAAVDQALADGRILEEGAVDLRARAVEAAEWVQRTLDA